MNKSELAVLKTFSTIIVWDRGSFLINMLKVFAMLDLSIQNVDKNNTDKTELHFLLCVATVRGYNPATGGPGSSLMDANVEQDTIRELSQRKQVGKGINKQVW